MRSKLFPRLLVLMLSLAIVCSENPDPLWMLQAYPSSNDLSRPFFLDSLDTSSNFRKHAQPPPSIKKRVAAMGVDLPDYILHYNRGKSPDLGSFRERMQLSGRR